MPQLKLTYFDFHGGRAEPVRLALHIGGVAFVGTHAQYDAIDAATVENQP